MKKFIAYTTKVFTLSFFTLIMFFLFLSTSTFFTPKLENSLFQFGALNGKLRQRSLMFRDWVRNSEGKKALFIGSSAMYRNYNPKYLKDSISGFNIGSPGMNIETAKDVLSSFIDLDIDYYVLEVSPILWNLKRYETRKNWIQDWHNPLTKEVFKIAINSKRVKEYLMYSYSIIKYLNPFSKYNPSKSKRNTSLSFNGVDCVDTYEFKNTYQNFKLKLSNENFKSLHKLNKLFKRKNKKIFYVINPNYNLDYSLDNFPVNVIDFNKIVSIDQKYFNDEVHLNCEGLDFFSKNYSIIYDKAFK